MVAIQPRYNANIIIFIPVVTRAIKPVASKTGAAREPAPLKIKGEKVSLGRLLTIQLLISSYCLGCLSNSPVNPPLAACGLSLSTRTQKDPYSVAYLGFQKGANVCWPLKRWECLLATSAHTKGVKPSFPIFTRSKKFFGQRGAMADLAKG